MQLSEIWAHKAKYAKDPEAFKQLLSAMAWQLVVVVVVVVVSFIIREMKWLQTA